ncbi:MAG: hypothetical protein JWR00_2540 [Rubritepida sp.]|nr:hypothetical protein [Rubritepida sp.]
MSDPHSLRRRTFLGGSAALGAASMAQAQSGGLPAGTVSIVVPYGAGSTNDIIARLVAPEVSALLGHTVVIENRPGAGGTLGIGQVVRARPDGLTLALVSASSIPINKALYRNLPFDPVRDLTLLVIAGSTPNALVVSADSGINSLADLIALGKRPGQPPLRHFSPGNGTSQHLSCAQLATLTGLTVENVPYRGPAEGLTGMMAGETNFGFASVPSVVGLIRDGRLRALGTTGPRESTLAGVPTLVWMGYPGFGDTDVWYGIAAPKGMPAGTQALLRSAFGRALADDGLKQRLQRAGFDPVPPSTPEQLDAFVQTQVAFWADLVRTSGATLD